MSHPDTVVHLEHDGQVLLVNEQGEGPQVASSRQNGGDSCTATSNSTRNQSDGN